MASPHEPFKPREPDESQSDKPADRSRPHHGPHVVIDAPTQRHAWTSDHAALDFLEPAEQPSLPALSQPNEVVGPLVDLLHERHRRKHQTARLKHAVDLAHDAIRSDDLL